MKTVAKLLHIDLAYVLKNGGVIGVSHFIGTMCGFAITLLLANFIDPTTYGQYKYVVAVAGVLTAFSLTGAPSALLQSVSKGYEGSFLHERRLTILWGIPFLLLSVLLGCYYIIQNDTVLGLGVALLGAISYLQSIFILHVSFLNGKRDFKRLSLNQILGGVTNVVGVGAAIVLNLTTVLWLIVAYNGSQLVYQIYASRKTLRAYTPNSHVSQKEIDLSKHLSLGNCISFISEYLDKILIFQFLGPAELALYAFAVGIPDQFRSINKVAKAIIVPKLNTKDDANLAKSVETHTRTYVIICLMLTLAFFFISPYLYRFLFPVYVNAAPYASLYMLMLPIIASGMLHGEAIQVKRHVRHIYVIRFAEPITKILLFVFLIPTLGITGAILGILMSKGVAIALQVIFFKCWKRSVESKNE